ncbi:MAG: hypothetical protein A2Y17_12965 [Clostridiales bacterium GWF2_38_85]|nr:MAG: hypothetical protein A2Y17_12965 [Clostridiales bacterium GWF2_38_85]HBL84169.1 YafY family transcriptional regulator [Clostridiales bacterium]
MKTDRLYAITVYLLNHGKTTAAELSHKFEVSRDIDSLCQAEIPVVAETGANGGYYLPDSYRMDKHTVTKDDYSFILTALKGFASAMGDSKVNATMEKITSLADNPKNSIILDFSVLREGDTRLLQTLEESVREKRPVSFEYTNAGNVTRIHTVEPIAVVYRWYAWYLLAYSRVKNDYRTYKLIRMRNAEIVDGDFVKEHESAEKILQKSDDNIPQQCTEITVRCKAEARAKAVEYLNGKITCEYDNGDCDMTLYVIESEHFWFGTLLSLGDGVEIISPEHIRARVFEAAKNILFLYQKL